MDLIHIYNKVGLIFIWLYTIKVEIIEIEMKFIIKKCTFKGKYFNGFLRNYLAHN